MTYVTLQKPPHKSDASNLGAYCWTSCFLCRRRASGTLFLPTSLQHLLCSLSENVGLFISYHSRILALSTKLSFSPCVVLVVAICYLGHPKNLLIDWLIDSWRQKVESIYGADFWSAISCLYTLFRCRSNDGSSILTVVCLGITLAVSAGVALGFIVGCIMLFAVMTNTKHR